MSKFLRIFKDEPFDERPSALLAQELRFQYYRGLLSTSFSIIGGAVALKGLLIPDTAVNFDFIIGMVLLATGGFLAFEGQTRVINNLERRNASTTFWQRAFGLVAALEIGAGTGFLISYFFENFTLAGS